MRPPIDSQHEKERLFFLRSTGLLDTAASEAFDRITRFASDFFEVPIALISLLDEQRQWFKSRVGLDATATSRATSFCQHTIQTSEVMVVEDSTQDARFVDNPFVLGDPHVRFYAGAPLVLPSGHALGSLCLIDRKPRSFSPRQRKQLADLASLVMAQIDLHQLAGRVHEVTRLPNRAQLLDDLKEQALLHPGAGRTLLLLEVMGYGQMQSAIRAVGVAPLERALRTIATNLLMQVGNDTLLYQVGETRFAILMHGDDQAAHSDAAAALLAQVREPFLTNGVSVQLDDAVAGMAHFSLSADAVNEAMRMATSALYQAVSEQRPFVWHSAAFDVPQRRAYTLLRDIPQGMAQGEFRLVYQPKLNLGTRQYSGVEALSRWEHPRHGNVPPSEFIALIEQTTLVHDFTEWVLHTALAQLVEWHAQGERVTMAVNVSSHNLEHPNFLKVLRNALATYGVGPEYLHIECTENAVMAGTQTAAVLDQVRAMGVQISLDDFGVGYCNLACLHSLPVALLKLDQSLIRPIAEQERAWTLVQSLIQLGHALGYRLLAEGVENRTTFNMLVSAGCDALQGYYLSRPLEADVVLSFLQQSRKTPLLMHGLAAP